MSNPNLNLMLKLIIDYELMNHDVSNVATGQFPPVQLPPDNYPLDNCHPDNSHLGQLPTVKFPLRNISPR